MIKKRGNNDEYVIRGADTAKILRRTILKVAGTYPSPTPNSRLFDESVEEEPV